ncbi:hypothetical protein BCR39DRAFT_217896 [Naematelia encephala]|uniref:Uncharacterized protein n=1 Tax=Naematelia encephala TaxID=71784 RepID=A0A1Y2AYT4_9TREE|nr:hypothetical protein BCR39DRAFT_217896 [Naematelia encephala]
MVLLVVIFPFHKQSARAPYLICQSYPLLPSLPLIRCAYTVRAVTLPLPYLAAGCLVGVWLCCLCFSPMAQ